jgi:arylsulfatase A
VSDQVWAFWDIMATVADISGMKAPADTDGISLYPLLRGDKATQQAHRFLYWEYQGEQAVRMGNWYAVKTRKANLHFLTCKRIPANRKTSAAQYPEVAKEILQIMKTEHTPGYTWPSPGETEEAFSQRLKRANIPAKPVNREIY